MPFDHTIEMKWSGKTLDKGNMIRVSPHEPVQALVLQIADRINDGADEQEVALWRQVILSGKGKFVLVGSLDAQYFNCTNFRGKVSAEGLWYLLFTPG